eukprot:11117743-Alexandrium_andersonii.AAC.1
MSASLVGSEMCIRDRSGGTQRSAVAVRAPLRASDGVPDGASEGFPMGFPMGLPCLLYTSPSPRD